MFSLRALSDLTLPSYSSPGSSPVLSFETPSPLSPRVSVVYANRVLTKMGGSSQNVNFIHLRRQQQRAPSSICRTKRTPDKTSQVSPFLLVFVGSFHYRSADVLAHLLRLSSPSPCLLISFLLRWSIVLSWFLRAQDLERRQRHSTLSG